MKYKILYLIHTQEPGGAEKMVIELVSNLDKDKFYPIVCLAKEGWLYEKLKKRNIKIKVIKTERRFDLLWSLKIASFVKNNKIHLIHSHLLDSNFYGAIASLLSSCPQVATEHGEVHYLKEPKILFKYLFTNLIAKKIVAVSKSTKERLKQIKCNNVMVIYNGLNLSVFQSRISKPEVRRKLNIPEEAIVVICIANLHQIKGQDVLLKSFSLIYQKFPNLYVLLVGKGKEEENLKRKAEIMRVKDRVYFLGIREDIPELLAASDIFVLPSFSEAFPVSLLEAMASGIPVIATKVGGIPEMIEEKKSGFLVSPGSPYELAEKISALAEDERLRKSMGSYGKKIVKKFSIDIMTSKYEKLYLSILSHAKKKK